jgi:putative molybdopterin biosynthesis protein
MVYELTTGGATGAAQLQHPLFGLLAAIESERSIASAARKLGYSYRHVWDELKRQEVACGCALVRRQPGRGTSLSSYGRRLLAGERRALARLAPEIDRLAGKLEEALRLVRCPGVEQLAVCGSYEPLLANLRAELDLRGGPRLDISYEETGGKALAELNAGNCHLAGIHLPLDTPMLCRRGSPIHKDLGRHLRLGEHKMIRLSVRTLGLAVAAGNPLRIQALSDLVGPDVRIVDRTAGSTTRLIFDQLLKAGRISATALHRCDDAESTEQAVAAAVAGDFADCGFTTAAAAASFRLDFVALLPEWYFLVCRKEGLESRAVMSIVDTLRSAEYRRIAEALAGHQAGTAGEIISLRRTLPWYK